jgi:arylsulfatase A-like enzyme
VRAFKNTIIPALILAIVTTAMHAGCDSRPEGPPNVILITMDTMRADHMGCYGYERPTSPRMDALAKKATLFTNALATSSWTVPSHASLFTGMYPFEHGSHAFRVERTTLMVNPLHEDRVTLAEVFEAEGYRTGGFAANTAWMTRRTKLDQGFQSYYNQRFYSKPLNERVLAWIGKKPGERFFVFINYIDTHRPYNTTQPAPFLEQPAEADKGSAVKQLIRKVMPKKGEPVIPEDLVQTVVDQYDTGVWNLDAEIGLLIDSLKVNGLYENTMIVLTSDHGEYFGEHYLVEHSKDIYEEAIWVPLIVKNPGQRRGRVDRRPTTATDIPNLILSECGELGAKYLDRFRDAPGNHEVIAELYYSRRPHLLDWPKRFDRIRTAIYDDPYKFIHSTDGNHELYNLREDRAESNNLFLDKPDVAARLAERLQQFQSARGRRDVLVDTTPLTPEEIKQLKALGYLSD